MTSGDGIEHEHEPDERAGGTIGPGRELGGFVIEEEAGRGGMGVVYRARQIRPQRTVALKVVVPALASDPGFRTRFERESEIAAQIEHPNVIPVYAVGDDAGVVFIAMRFVVGTDLRTVLTREGRLEPGRAATIVDQVAQALDAAHAVGLVHRDVKPSNVLIATSGREHAYLTDFGLARHVEGGHHLTDTGALVGTIDYIAPEQIRGERVDARTDVYSLGCMLFQSLTGTVPFPLDNDLAKLYAHGTQPPPAVRERAPELPAAFDAVLTRAMAKDPDDRFQSAGDLGRAAVAAAENAQPAGVERSVASGAAAPAAEADPVPSPAETRVGAADPAATPPRRRRLLLVGAAIAVAVIAAAALIALLAGGSGGGTSGGDDAATPAPPGERVVGRKQLRVKGGPSYTLALSVPGEPGGEANAEVPLTMSLLAARGGEPEKVIQRKRLPAPPYRFANDSYISELQLAPAPDKSASVDLSWFIHPGDPKTVTCYATVSLGGIALHSCS